MGELEVDHQVQQTLTKRGDQNLKFITRYLRPIQLQAALHLCEEILGKYEVTTIQLWIKTGD